MVSKFMQQFSPCLMSADFRICHSRRNFIFHTLLLC